MSTMSVSWWLVIASLGVAVLGVGSPAHLDAAPERRLATAETLVGAWNGHWTGEGRAGRGSMGLVLARAPGADEVVGQFTFITGGVTRTLRYEGRIEDGRVEFPLVGDGHIALEPLAAVPPGTAARLRGEWTDTRGALPAPTGVIELSRTN
jgi:hypothetical protein